MGSVNIAMTLAKGDYTEFTKSGQHRENVKKVVNELEGIISGSRQSDVTITSGSADFVAASQTVTCDQSAFTTGDIISIIGVNLTEGTDFDADTDDATTATNLATAINANATLLKFFTASASAAVVTITCNIPGEIGNYLINTTVTVNAGTPMTLSNSGAFTSGTGGTDGSAVTAPA